MEKDEGEYICFHEKSICEIVCGAINEMSGFGLFVGTMKGGNDCHRESRVERDIICDQSVMNGLGSVFISSE
jgi:hypothetical protein